MDWNIDSFITEAMGQGVGFMTEMKPARYCHVVDGRQWKDLAQLFTEKPLVSTGSWVPSMAATRS